MGIWGGGEGRARRGEVLGFATGTGPWVGVPILLSSD